jgi:hypothetical protein
MGMAKDSVQVDEGLSFTSAAVGTGLSVAAALSFQFLCMVLPLVGKAGMNPQREYQVRNLMGLAGPHGFDSYVLQNRITFLLVLFLTLGLSVAAFLSKQQRRKLVGGPFPRLTAGLSGICVFLLVAHVTGLLQI